MSGSDSTIPVHIGVIVAVVVAFVVVVAVVVILVVLLIRRSRRRLATNFKQHLHDTSFSILSHY